MGRPSGPLIEGGVGIVKKPTRGKSPPVALTPELLARDDSEHGHQAALIVWASEQMRLPGFAQLEWLHAIPNGGDRDRITAGRMKAEGVKSGVLDLFLPHARGGYHGLYIEMKKPAKVMADGKKRPAGQLSDTQEAFITYGLGEGYLCVTCWTWIQARDLLLEYFSWPRPPEYQKFNLRNR